MFLIRCYKHSIFHKMLISIPDMKRFWKVLVSGSCVEETSAILLEGWKPVDGSVIILSEVLHQSPLEDIGKVKKAGIVLTRRP